MDTFVQHSAQGIPTAGRILGDDGSPAAALPPRDAPGMDTAHPPGDHRPAPASFKGYVDGLSHEWRVIGWVRPLTPEPQRLQVHLVEDTTVLDTATADMFRGDLLGAMIGDGQYGFSLRIPARLFDGSHHSLDVRVAGEPGGALVGHLEASLPNRAPSRAFGMPPQTASDVLQAVLPPRRTQRESAEDTQIAELTAVLEAIARIYDHATALGCLYVHVLRRRIDHDGLQTRLTRLSARPGDLPTVIREVLASDEAKQLYKPGSVHRFPDISALEVWTRLRRTT